MRAPVYMFLLALVSMLGCGESVECVVDTDCTLGNRCEAEMCVELNTPPVRDAAAGDDAGGDSDSGASDAGGTGDDAGAMDAGAEDSGMSMMDVGAAIDTGA